MDTSNMTNEQLIAALKTATEQNVVLKAKANPPITLKVSEKGAVSVYGLGRFPVTLYGAQMSRLLDHEPQIRAFIADNGSKLATK
jgi:hypothetical protein